MWGWQMTAWNRDFFVGRFYQCQQIVRQMPDHLPKVNAFRNSAHTDGLGGDFCCWPGFSGFLGFLKETTVCKWWTSCATNLSVKSAKWRRRWVFLKLFCFFFGKWILKVWKPSRCHCLPLVGQWVDPWNKCGRILWGTVENLHAVLTSWHSNLGRSLRGQPFLFLIPVSHRSIYSILCMHFMVLDFFLRFFLS